MTLDIYGRQLPAPFAFFDPESSLPRMSQHTLLSDSTASSLILPAWGMTRGGALYELRTPALLTSEPASSSSLPTPTASDAKGSRSSTQPREPGSSALMIDTLTDAVTILVGDRVRFLPTPRATRGGSSTETMYALGGELSTDHRTQGEVLLPTPTAGDAKDSRNSTVQREPGSQAHPGDTLTDAVTILVGDRTRQPSSVGKPSSAA